MGAGGRGATCGKYRRSRALSKSRSPGYFAPHALGRERRSHNAGAIGLHGRETTFWDRLEPVRAGPDDDPFSSRDGGRAARGAGDARARLPAARRARPPVPRVLGYLLVAFAVGPAWLGLVRRDEIEALRFIADAGVAAIALAAGSALRVDALRGGRLEL